MSTKLYYRNLCRRYNRLPLDKLSIFKLRILTKNNFLDTHFNKKKYDKHRQLLDDILIHENYDKIEKLLDLIYKQNLDILGWVLELKNTNYLELKQEWPQVHLIYELTSTGDKKHLKEYEEKLKTENNDDICLMKHFGLEDISVLKPLAILPRANNSASHGDIINESKILHKFLFDNQTKLTHLKILPIEALYPTNRFGLPLHVTKRDKILRRKITYIKSLFEEFQTISKTDLEHLVSFATYNGGSGKDPKLELPQGFFKYMKKKHDIEKVTLNPLVRKFIRSKTLIPNDNNIRKYYRDYVRKQYYLEDRTYKMCWMQNFYENAETL